VVDVRGGNVVVDIGYKSEGAIPASEFDDSTQIKPGDVFNVLLAAIEDEDGMVVLSKSRADQQLRWQRVVETCAEGSVVSGVVRGRVRGGLLVDVGGVEAFLPTSQVDVTPGRNADGCIGQTMDFKVLKISGERRNIIVSRRELIEEQLRGKKRELLSTIEVGQRRKGRAKNITDFGVFVDLDGLDGLLHITDMSWGRVKHPSEIVKVGDELEVVVLDVDREKERVSLGLKQRSTNPWADIETKYPVGSRLRGKVVNLAPYGGFVEIEQGVEGLVHVSEISWTKRIARAADVLEVGQEVDVVVLGINKDEQRIALGMRQMEANPWDTVRDRYPVGSRVSGKVRNFTPYGAFVEIEEGIDGMIHVSDMSWTRKVAHPSEALEKGQEVAAIVLEVDAANRRISLGLKQAQEDPWMTLTSRYRVGDIVSGKVTKLASFGAFIELGEGVDGLVHISQLSDQHVEKVKDVVDVGAEVRARIIRIDVAERRIGLSIKAALLPDEEFARHQADFADTLKPGERIVDLAGALDEALGTEKGEEWSPGQARSKDRRKDRDKYREDSEER
jgi:small subunit ribosomal protein S1